MAPYLGPRYLPLFRKNLPAIDRQKESFHLDNFRGDPGFAGYKTIEPNGQATLAQGFKLLALVHVVKHHVDLRMRLPEGQDDLRQNTQDSGTKNTDIDSPKLSVEGLVCPFHCLIGQREDGPSFLREEMSSFREFDATIIAGQKRRAEIRFQLVNLPGQRRLRYVQPLCRSSNVLLLGDGKKGFEQPELHGVYLEMSAIHYGYGWWPSIVLDGISSDA